MQLTYEETSRGQALPMSAPMDNEQSGITEGLGSLQHIYYPEPALPFLGLLFLVVWSGICLVTCYRLLDALAQHTVAELPLPPTGMELLLLGEILLLVCAGWGTVRAFRQRVERILLYDRGLRVNKRSGAFTLRWEEISSIKRDETTFQGTHSARIDVWSKDGRHLRFTSSLGNYTDLLAQIERQTQPFRR